MAITARPATAVATISGTWTHTVGAAAETLELAGFPLLCKFSTNKSSGVEDTDIKFSTSTSGTITTITLYCNTTVTDGRFVILYQAC